MTTHPADARPSCMVAALDNIRAAQKLKLEPGTKNRVREPLPELYWSLMAEAAIYAELARADVSVGLVAGEHLVQRDERVREQKRLFADRAAQRHPHRAAADAATIAVGRRVRVTDRMSDYHDRIGIVTSLKTANPDDVVVNLEADRGRVAGPVAFKPSALKLVTR